MPDIVVYVRNIVKNTDVEQRLLLGYSVDCYERVNYGWING